MMPRPIVSWCDVGCCIVYGGDYMKTESPLDAAMKRVDIVVLMNMLLSDPECSM